MADQDVLYVRMSMSTGDADLGKLAEGSVIAVTAAQAERFKRVGIATASTEAAFKNYQEKREKVAHREHGAQAQFDALNQAQSDDWDTSTTRDVTMAPDAGIRRAFEQGRLVNTALLRDPDGNVLPQDATLEQILEARHRLAKPESELTAHDRSSVQGGGPHTSPAFAPVNAGTTLEGRAPLNAKSQKLSPGQLGNGPTEPEEKGRKSDPAEGAKGRSAKK